MSMFEGYEYLNLFLLRKIQSAFFNLNTKYLLVKQEFLRSKLHCLKMANLINLLISNVHSNLLHVLP